MFKSLSTTVVVAFALAAPAAAATLNGTFDISIYQRDNTNATQAAATQANLIAATAFETITYTGDLSFGTFLNSGPTEDDTTIGSWLASGGGIVSGLSLLTAGRQLSTDDINTTPATARTTYFDIVGIFSQGFDSVIAHDDGISVFDDGSEIANSQAPTNVRNTNVGGFNGGQFRIIYAATNGDPSVLRVTGDNLPSTVPVPAALPLLLVGLGGFAALRRRRAKA